MVILAARLSRRVQQNIGIIRAGVVRGLDSEAIQDLIRQTGQSGLRRQDLLQGMRNIRGIAEGGVRVRRAGLDRFADPARIAQSRTPMISNFSYDVRIGPEFNEDGTRNQRFLTVRSDRNLTERSILEEAESALETAGELAKYARLQAGEVMSVEGARRK